LNIHLSIVILNLVFQIALVQKSKKSAVVFIHYKTSWSVKSKSLKNRNLTVSFMIFVSFLMNVWLF